MREAIRKFFACLTNTIFFVHRQLIKHMDIKPSNFLVEQRLRNGQISHHIYLADFGIARSYENAVDVETDSRTPFSKTYAAPEVVRQDKRGFPADIFSLGCVFLEMLAVLSQQRQKIIDIRRRHPEGDSSYQANLKELRRSALLTTELRVQPGSAYLALSREDKNWYGTTRQMMAFEAAARPIAYHLTLLPDTECCKEGPEPFEAAPP
jgi:serine/threonine protein kinase